MRAYTDYSAATLTFTASNTTFNVAELSEVVLANSTDFWTSEQQIKIENAASNELKIYLVSCEKSCLDIDIVLKMTYGDADLYAR